tara:strand:+ start:1800 stop:2426 length:627 start_codon:yes stop_codon:yes gene_type:complete
MNEFDLRKFLYKNPLLEDQEEKDEASKKALDKKEDELDEKDMEHEDLKDKIKHHEGAIKNIKKELEDLSTDLGEDEEDLKKEKEEVKEVTETPKLTKEGLKDMIKEKITAILTEDEEFDADKDIEIEANEKEEIDIEKDIKVDDVQDREEIEVDAEVAGQSADDSGLEGLLKKAREIAREQGNDKLVRQISNTIIQHERSIAAASEEA